MFYQPTSIQQAPQPSSLIQSICSRIEGGSRNAWGIGFRSHNGRYYLMHQGRCIPLDQLRLDLISVRNGTRITRTECDLDFQVVIYQDPETPEALAGLYRSKPSLEVLLSMDEDRLIGYLFAVGKSALSQYPLTYGFFAVFTPNGSCILGDSSQELLKSWDFITQLLWKGSNGAK